VNDSQKTETRVETELVNRFLTWPVPADVRPDGTQGKPARTGANLLTADQARQMLAHVLAHAPVEGAGMSIVINAYQLRQAAEFAAPDYETEPEQRATVLELERLPAGTFNDGEERPAGLYCWLQDDPQEGCMLLDETPPRKLGAAALQTQTAQPCCTYTQADLLEAVKTERYACSIAVWMTLQDALAEGADDKGLEGWMREAEARVKGRLEGVQAGCVDAATAPHLRFGQWGALRNGPTRALLQARDALTGPVADGFARRCAVSNIDQVLATEQPVAQVVPAAQRWFPEFNIVVDICKFALRHQDSGMLEAASHQVERLLDALQERYQPGQHELLAKMWLQARDDIKVGRRVTPLVPSAPPDFPHGTASKL
jgi:hypothetical protein